jgi:hypothetical protein
MHVIESSPVRWQNGNGPSKLRPVHLLNLPRRPTDAFVEQAWNYIVDFEIVPVLTSQEYWARFGG